MAAPEVPQKESEFEKLKVPIQDIIAFTNTLDERYREKCFEVLLNFYLNKNTRALITPTVTDAGSTPKADLEGISSALPLQIRAFLSQHEIPEDTVRKLFLIEGNEVIPTYNISARARDKTKAFNGLNF